MSRTTAAAANRVGQVHFRHHGLCWALPAVLCLLAPLCYGLTLIPAAVRVGQLLRRQAWLGDASVIVVRGAVWRKVTQLALVDVEYVQVKPGLFGGLVDCGSVIVHGVGGVRLVLPNLAHPKAAQRAIQRALKVVPRGHVRDERSAPNALPVAA
jgi:Bacterial PH domain